MREARKIRTCGRVHRVLAMIANHPDAYVYEKDVRVAFSEKNIEMALKYGLVERVAWKRPGGLAKVYTQRPTNDCFRLRLTEVGWEALEELDSVQPYREGRVRKESREYKHKAIAEGRDTTWSSGQCSLTAGFRFVQVEIEPDPFWVEYFRNATW